MTELDPFGRKKGEDPLASLGWSGSADTTEPESAPPDELPHARRTAEPERPAPTPPRHEPGPRRERQAGQGPQFGPGRAIRGLVVLGIVVAALGGVLASFVSTGADKVERFVGAFTTQRPASSPPAPASEVPSGRAQRSLQPAPQPAARAEVAPVGLGRGSLLRPFAFGAALKKLRTGGYGRLANLRVAAERIDATLLTRAGALRHLQIVPGGAVRRFGTGSTGFSAVPTMSLRGIDAGAPQRLARAAAERLRVQPSRVNYLVYSQFGGVTQWNVYFKGGQIFSADAGGRITRRIS